MILSLFLFVRISCYYSNSFLFSDLQTTLSYTLPTVHAPQLVYMITSIEYNFQHALSCHIDMVESNSNLIVTGSVQLIAQNATAYKIFMRVLITEKLRQIQILSFNLTSMNAIQYQQNQKMVAYLTGYSNSSLASSYNMELITETNSCVYFLNDSANSYWISLQIIVFIQKANCKQTVISEGNISNQDYDIYGLCRINDLNRQYLGVNFDSGCVTNWFKQTDLQPDITVLLMTLTICVYSGLCLYYLIQYVKRKQNKEPIVQIINTERQLKQS